MSIIHDVIYVISLEVIPLFSLVISSSRHIVFFHPVPGAVVAAVALPAVLPGRPRRVLPCPSSAHDGSGAAVGLLGHAEQQRRRAAGPHLRPAPGERGPRLQPRHGPLPVPRAGGLLLHLHGGQVPQEAAVGDASEERPGGAGHRLR